MVAPSAPYALDVELQGLEPLLRKMKNPRLLRAPIKTVLNKSVLIGEREAKLNAPKDTGRLARSLAVEVDDLTARVFFQNEQLYFQVQEVGRRPGAPPPPPSALLPWMRRKGIDPSLAFVIARAIGRRGFKRGNKYGPNGGRFFMKRGAEAIQREMPAMMRDLMAGVKREWLR
jgi:hypothetical protein